MSLEISDQELAAVSQLPTAQRYTYFIQRVCDWEEVWTLRAEDGYVVMGDNVGNQYIPVWPAARFAAQYGGAGEEPAAIALDVWIERWLPGMERDQTGVAVFPVEGDGGAVVDLDEHRDDLVAELEQHG